MEQHANQGSAPVPPLNTHSEVYSYQPRRLVVSAEYYAMQGVDSHAKGGVLSAH